jgi:preprotein translocase subunit YajC
VPALFLIVILAAVIWFTFVLPARRRRSQHAAMQDSVELGDEIITAGGLHGFVRELGDDRLRIEIAPDVVVTLDRRAVAAVARDVDVEVEVEPDDEHEDHEEPDEQIEHQDRENGHAEARHVQQD